VTLKSIAQNPEIHEGMPREEIEAAIKRHAEQEVLHDQPLEDRSRVRVTGPFTVEALSPHRALDPVEAEPTADGRSDFVPTIIDNLRKAGVQNTRKEERLQFAWLEPHAGTWVHARGSFEDADGTERTVAVSIGPEYGTVGEQQVRDAVLESMRGVGVDLVLVCGFAFEASTSEVVDELRPETREGFATAAEERRIGRQRVLLVRMNPDLSMGADLLKKTGAGNLFMVFGEPDVDVRTTVDDLVEVELRGLDVYDPTTGEVRSSSTDDIAAWFVDTSYDEQVFFVREAYFTGGNDPYASLRKALRADIDEDAWASLYRTTSRPFAPPATGRIAVKVINHYGDEVMKVYRVPGGST
jgi:adenine-specific DNA-methyltransferase